MLIIKEVAKEKGYSITSLAEKLGMTQVSLSRIINGNPTVDTLKKISDVIGVDIKDLFVSTKEGETSPEPLYIKRGGEMVKVGEIDLPRL
jgi:transcriptional regulator with XRE-family HTH domain